eukprot:gene519-3475_t
MDCKDWSLPRSNSGAQQHDVLRDMWGAFLKSVGKSEHDVMYLIVLLLLRGMSSE